MKKRPWVSRLRATNLLLALATLYLLAAALSFQFLNPTANPVQVFVHPREALTFRRIGYFQVRP